MMWLAISIVHRTERPFATTGRINHLLVKDHESLNNPSVVFECLLPVRLFLLCQCNYGISVTHV